MRGRRLLLLLIGLPLYTAALMFVSTVTVFGLVNPMDLWNNPRASSTRHCSLTRPGGPGVEGRP